MFRKVRNFFKPHKPTDNIYGLTQEQKNALKELRQHPGWKSFQVAVDTAINIHAETILFATLPEDILTARGAVRGLREAGTLVDRIILGDERLEREQRKLDTRDRTDTSIFYGTDYARRRP